MKKKKIADNSRKKVIAGNWKMNKTLSEGVSLIMEINNALRDRTPACEIILAVPYIHLWSAVAAVDPDTIDIAAQNCADKNNGAFTGEISAAMIASTGANYVILGHSERRAYYHETPDILRTKVQLALANRLVPIFCIGETLNEREAKQHFQTVDQQLYDSLFDLSPADFAQLLIAYEPVWAIGTGQTATAPQAQEMHAHIRQTIAQQYGQTLANKTRILYGGSMNADNAASLLAQPDVDGGLIGGASLSSDKFLPIIHACK